MILGLHHAAIATPNPDRLAAFYSDNFGFKKIYESKWSNKPQNDAMMGLPDSAARVIVLRKGDQCLELFKFTNPQTGEGNPDRPLSEAGFTHIGFEVTDIDSEYALLKAAGMRFNAPPTPGPAVRAAYGRDPEGNSIELLELLGEHPINFKLAEKVAKQGAA